MAPTSITALVDAADRGEPGASETLFTTLYNELHRIALGGRGARYRPITPRSLGVR